MAKDVRLEVTDHLMTGEGFEPVSMKGAFDSLDWFFKVGGRDGLRVERYKFDREQIQWELKSRHDVGNVSVMNMQDRIGITHSVDGVENMRQLSHIVPDCELQVEVDFPKSITVAWKDRSSGKKYAKRWWRRDLPARNELAH